MYKLSLLAITGLFLTLSGSAQTKTDKAQVNWGSDMDMKEDGTFMDVIGDLDNSIYMLMGRHNKPFIQRMDGLKVAYQKPLELELDKKELVLKRVMLTRTEILVFATRYDKKVDEFTLYYSSYDQASFNPLKRFEQVAVVHSEKSRNAGGFLISSSPDRSKVLVRVDQPFEKGEDEKFQLTVYDASMGSLWWQNLELPFKDEEFSMESQRVDDDGSVLMLGIKYADKEQKRELKKANKATYEYHMLVYTAGSSSPQDNIITVADKFLQDMTISIANEGDIICAGFFGNKGSFSVRGAFYLRLDRASKQIVHQSYKEFSDDFITSYMTEKEANKAKKKAEKKEEEIELPEFELHDIIHREDGGAVLIAEQFFVREVTTQTPTGNGGTMTSTSYHYYYNDVIAVNISPEGDVEWAAKVPKRQHSVNDGGAASSCAVEVKGSNIYLVFNDSGENLFVKPGDKIKQFELKGKDALVVLATMDRDGKVSREALFSPDRRDVILRPKDCVELKNQDMFIYANRGRDYRFGMIVFK